MPSTVQGVRASVEERQLWKWASSLTGEPMNTWIRRVLREEAEAVVAEAKERQEALENRERLVAMMNGHLG